MTPAQPIPFLDLRAQYRSIGAEVSAAVVEVLESGNYVLGPSVAAFESAFAAYCGTRHAVAVSSGTAALHLALLSAGIGPGDEVLTVPMTFVATVAAILYAGATPRFVDIDPVTWTMDPSALEAAITPRTRAIVPVHLHGRLADMPRISAVAAAHGLTVIEDAAQAHGAARGARAGAAGDLGCFSFYPGKNLGACGEGGAVVTDRDDLADRVRCLRDWGQAERYKHVLQGFNYRMDGIQGAVLAVKLRHLEAWTEARRTCARRYDRLLAGIPVGRPAPGDADHVWHVYAVRVHERERVRAALAEAGIATGMHYPIPVHLQPAYASLGECEGAFPVSERLARETLSLPLYPELSPEAIDRVCETIAAAGEKMRLCDADAA